MIALHNIGSQRSLEPIGFQACAEPLDGDDQAVSCTELNHRISPTPERDGALNHHARYEARDSCAGLRKRFSNMVNCAVYLVIQVPTLLFQTDLVPDGRAGE